MQIKGREIPFWLVYIVMVLITFILIAIITVIGIIILKGKNKKKDVVATYNPIVVEEQENEEIEDVPIQEIRVIEKENSESKNEEIIEEENVEEAIATSGYINDVPFINQDNIGYPTGCEAVAATMVAKFNGYNVDVEKIIANTPTDEQGKRKENGVWIAENPFKYFVGYPTKTKAEGSYGCFAEPIEVALKASGVQCKNISGCNIETVYKYIAQGEPVIIWCRAGGKDLTEGVTWKYPDGSGQFLELVGEHCAVLIGYDESQVYLNDPAIGKGVSQPRAKFEENWYKLYSQAIIVE